MSDAAAASDLPQETQLPSTSFTDENDSKSPKELPLEVIHMIITNLAKIGGQDTVTAMLLSKELAPKFSKFVFNRSVVHWINLDDFMAALKREDIQEISFLTIDLRQESIDRFDEYDEHIPHVPHPERLPDPEKDKKRYDCDGPSDALFKCNFKVANLRTIELYQRMDYNKGLNKEFASFVRTLTCLDRGGSTIQDGLRNRRKLFESTGGGGFDCGRRMPFDFPNCRYLWLKASDKSRLHVKVGKPIVNFPALDYVYIIYDTDDDDNQSFDAVELLGQINSFDVSAKHDPKIALVMQYHTTPPSSEMMKRAESLESKVSKELGWDYSGMTRELIKENHARRFLNRMAYTVMRCPKRGSLNSILGRTRIKKALEPIWQAKEKMRKDYPKEWVYDYRSCYPHFKGECTMKRKRDETDSD